MANLGIQSDSAQDDIHICHCSCHDPIRGRHTVHGFPCCSLCPTCGKRIQNGFIHVHREICLAQQERLVRATEAEARSLVPFPADVPSEAFDDISHVDDGRPPV